MTAVADLPKIQRRYERLAIGAVVLALALTLVARASGGRVQWTSWALPLLVLANLAISRVSRGRPRLAWVLSSVSIAVAGSIMYSIVSSVGWAGHQ